MDDALMQATVPWRGAHPRVAVVCTYCHAAVTYSWNAPPRVVLENLAPERQALFRDAWEYDFTTDPPTKNGLDRFLSRRGDSPPAPTRS